MRSIYFFEIIFIIVLLLPVACFLLYTSLGIFVNFNTLFSFFFIILLFIFLPQTLRVKSSGQKNFLLLFLMANLGCLLGHIVTGEGVFEYLRTFSSYYFYIVLGWLLYYLYYSQGKLKRLTTLFIRVGLFIATVNLFQYVLLNTDDLIVGNYSIVYNRYEPIVNYTTEMNKELADYIIIGYEDGRGLRPLGYFFDLHSQYYFPLLAAILLFFSNNSKPTGKDLVLIIYLFVTIFLSGIKTAIYSVALILLFLYIFSDNRKKYTKYVILGGVLAAAWGIEKVVELFTGSDAVLELALFWEHIVSLPYKLIVSYPTTFVLGGSPSLRLDPAYYSEVYWVTILFYIGLVGFFIYIKSYKTFYLSKYKYNPEAFFLFLLFAISLLHYSVYNRGANNYASAMVFMYLFVYLEKEKEFRIIRKSRSRRRRIQDPIQ